MFASSIALAQDAVVSAKIANLRGTSSITGSKVATLPESTPLTIIGTDGKWYLVQTSEYVGWMSRNLIDIVETEKPKPITLRQKAKVVGGKAVLRGTDVEDGVAITTLRNGESLDVYGIVGDWALVQSTIYAGWVSADSVQDVSPRSTSAETTRTGESLFLADNSDADSNPVVIIKMKRTKL